MGNGRRRSESQGSLPGRSEPVGLGVFPESASGPFRKHRRRPPLFLPGRPESSTYWASGPKRHWARKSLAATSGAVQADGITCIGPQPHSLATTFTIKFGNPAIAWGIKPPKEVKVFHELYVNGVPISLNFSIDSQINGANWKLYQGTETAPDFNQAIVSPVSFPKGAVNFLWLVGTIPDGTACGVLQCRCFRRKGRRVDRQKLGNRPDLGGYLGGASSAGRDDL